MQPDLDEYGVQVLGLSKDTAEEAAIHKKRDHLQLDLLADPELKVIRQYGVEHHKALGFVTGSFQLFGIPFGFTPSFKTMAIPTSLLVDEAGVIRWIDQAEDYRLRSSQAHVLGAVRAAFGETKPTA
jgi:alkyl hydroperoxide reductase subunit AhpC